jgi:regulator of protease activity HflC (stomatin/prohibitin superfamily)
MLAPTIFRAFEPTLIKVECRHRPDRSANAIWLARKSNRRANMDFGYIFLILFAIVAFFILSIVLGSFFTVETSQVAIVQRLGKFARVAGPGVNWKTPYLEMVVRRLSMKVQQFDVQVETKTQDNVFVQIPVSIQYKIIPESVESAYYKLSDPVKQIESMVYNVVLGHVPKMKLDDAFLNQADIAGDLRDSLDASMKEYGYSIVRVLISDIVPDQKVKAAMNDINAAQREREATVSRAETNKMLLVKQAEAEAESKRLQGEGIANQRKAIITGLKDSVEDFAKTVPGSTPQDVMQLVLMTQYFDTLKDIAANDHSNTILIPHSPNTLSDLFSQIRNAIMVGTEMAGHPSSPPITSSGLQK